MIYGLGIDICDLKRVKKICQKGDAFALKILTNAEFEIYDHLVPQRQIEFLAGRFSAKEAYSKALGTGIGKKVSFKDLEIIDDEKGAPHFTDHPYLKKLRAYISISHTTEYVVTEVILEKRG